MNSSNSEGKNISNEIMVKLFLENLIEKYSLKEIIDCIISETTLCYNNKHKKELADIISLICKNTSIDNIFKYILDLEDQKNIIDKEESQKRISLSTDEEEFGHLKNNNNIINISDDDMDNENIINITDSDDNINEKDTDLKIIKNRDYSFSKNINNKNKMKDLSYHYSIINGDCYKYKLKGINEDGIATFICFDKNCDAFGIYNLTNKMFTILKEHNVNNNYSCNRNLNSDDKIYFTYMKNINIDEMQIIND